MKLTIMLFVTFLASNAFATPVYYVNCTKAIDSIPFPEELTVEETKQGLKEMNLDPETAIPLFNSLKLADFYFVEKDSDTYLIVDKVAFDNSGDPAKGMTFGFGCVFAKYYEVIDKVKFRTEINAFYQVPADTEWIEFKGQ